MLLYQILQNIKHYRKKKRYWISRDTGSILQKISFIELDAPDATLFTKKPYNLSCFVILLFFLNCYIKYNFLQTLADITLNLYTYS